MPYFGLAHVAGPNPNSRPAGLADDPQGAGLKVIRNALERIDNGTERERELINALFVLYDKDAIADDRERDQAYLNTMRELHHKYLDDADIASMFGEAYRNTTSWDYWEPDGSRMDGTAEARAAFEAAMAVEDHHPGANHLYIHLMEASSEPELAMPSAQKLEGIVPISGHMVNMPGHIYPGVGEYEKAIDMNERSQIVDRQFAEVWGDINFPMIGNYALSHRSHVPHALDFVRYGNMLQGNYAASFEAAQRGTASVGRAVEAVNGGEQRVVQSWVVDKVFGKWARILEGERNHSGTPYLDGMWSYVRGCACVADGQFVMAEAELANIQVQAEVDGVDDTGVWPTPASHMLKLAAHALQGEFAEAQGNLDEAIAHCQAAVEMQDANNYTEPPDWSQSMRLYLGAALLDAGRAEDVEAVYRKDLEWNQQNGWSTSGLAQALEAQRKVQDAIIVKRQFDSLWRNADIELELSRL